MQRISKIRHINLVEALLQMERLLNIENKHLEDLQQTAEYRQELAIMYNNYERLLQELEIQIKTYDAFFNHVKVQYLGKKLKELKKEIHAEQPAYFQLTENIRLAYGT